MPGEIVMRIGPSYGFELVADQFGGTKFRKSFRLCFDFAAFARVEESTGVQLWQELKEWDKLVSATVLPVAFWAAALRHHPEYGCGSRASLLVAHLEKCQDCSDGFDAIRSYIDPPNAEKIHDAIFEAYLSCLSPDISKKIRALWDRLKKGEITENPTDQAATEATPSA